jgi:simple sugar transport system substrate-binding protein
MVRKVVLLAVLVALLGVVALVPVIAQDKEFVFGMILVGPKNDKGWSQAHFEGGQYVEKNVPGAKMLVSDNVNAANPSVTVETAVADFVDQGAKLVITASDDFQTDTTKVANDPAYKDIVFINVSGDGAYTGAAPANLGNLMGEMEWGKLIAGCAAGLTTETKNIGYLGPLINYETRRLVASAYLGARYCYETYRKGNPADLKFGVQWIGFWFNIPGKTQDPTEVTKNFFDTGSDVVISGIDTTEALVVAGQRAKEGKQVWAVPYDFAGACEEAPDICLGVPYFQWGLGYVTIVKAVMGGTYKQSFELIRPDWKDINNVDTSAVGFVAGPGLSKENKAFLDAFIKEMAAYGSDKANEGTVFLWAGPLKYQDGTEIAKAGEKLPYIAKVGEKASVWYLEQLLDGITGKSS